MNSGALYEWVISRDRDGKRFARYRFDEQFFSLSGPCPPHKSDVNPFLLHLLEQFGSCHLRKHEFDLGPFPTEGSQNGRQKLKSGRSDETNPNEPGSSLRSASRCGHCRVKRCDYDASLIQKNSARKSEMDSSTGAIKQSKLKIPF